MFDKIFCCSTKTRIHLSVLLGFDERWRPKYEPTRIHKTADRHTGRTILNFVWFHFQKNILFGNVMIRRWVVMYFPVQCTHPRTSRIVLQALAHAPQLLGVCTHTHTPTGTHTFHYYLFSISAIFWSQKIHLAKKSFQMCIKSQKDILKQEKDILKQ